MKSTFNSSMPFQTSTPFQDVSNEIVSLAKEVFVEDQVTVAEQIFGGKSEQMDELQLRRSALADKYNALAYEPLPATEGKVKIRVLAERKTPVDKT